MQYGSPPRLTRTQGAYGPKGTDGHGLLQRLDGLVDLARLVLRDAESDERIRPTRILGQRLVEEALGLDVAALAQGQLALGYRGSAAHRESGHGQHEPCAPHHMTLPHSNGNALST